MDCKVLDSGTGDKLDLRICHEVMNQQVRRNLHLFKCITVNKEPATCIKKLDAEKNA